jgi:hypothetical protein
VITHQEIIALTKEFNMDRNFPFEDCIVRRSFLSDLNSPIDHYERVVLLDSLFRTNLRRSRPVGAAERSGLKTISEKIRLKIPAMKDRIGELGIPDLFALDDIVLSEHGAIGLIVETILGCLDNNSLSFAGKYLHFSFPGLFPLWDSKVPHAINCYDEATFPPNPRTINHYLKLCRYYRKIRDDNLPHVDQMLEADFISQPEGWKHMNTLVRVIDKALWIRGRQLED